MGLSIHYSGNLNQAKLLSNLIEEVRDVAIIHNWKFHIYDIVLPGHEFKDKAFSKDIFGISFTPTKCETIHLTFLSNGVLVCPIKFYFSCNSQCIEEQLLINTISVNTQYAGVETHQLLSTF